MINKRQRPHLTPWFPVEVKPVYVGVYQTLESMWRSNAPFYPIHFQDFYYRHWNGEFWGERSVSPEEAELFKHYRDGKKIPWRGLAEQPETTEVKP